MPTAGSRLLEFAQESGQYHNRCQFTIHFLKISIVVFYGNYIYQTYFSSFRKRIKAYL